MADDREGDPCDSCGGPILTLRPHQVEDFTEAGFRFDLCRPCATFFDRNPQLVVGLLRAATASQPQRDDRLGATGIRASHPEDERPTSAYDQLTEQQVASLDARLSKIEDGVRRVIGTDPPSDKGNQFMRVAQREELPDGRVRLRFKRVDPVDELVVTSPADDPRSQLKVGDTRILRVWS